MPSTKYNLRLMKFNLVDQVIEQGEGRIVTIKELSKEEWFLRDHFPSFPIMPGVLMLESMVQAASALLYQGGGQEESGQDGGRLVLGEVKAVKYGAMVKPGDTLRVEVDVIKILEDGSFKCKGKGIVTGKDHKEEQTAVAGRFTMRTARLT